MPRNVKRSQRNGRRNKGGNSYKPPVSEGPLAHSMRSHGPLPLHHFVKTIRIADFVCQGVTSAYSFADYNFDHALIPGYTELAAVFKRVRINKLTYTFARANNGVQQGVAPYYTPLLISHVDPSGVYSGTPGDAYEVDQPSVQLHISNTPESNVITRSFTPAVLQEVYGGLTAGFEPAFRKFVDLADTSILHYGLRMHWQNPSAGATDSVEWARYYVFITMDLDFQGTR